MAAWTSWLAGSLVITARILEWCASNADQHGQIYFSVEFQLCSKQRAWARLLVSLRRGQPRRGDNRKLPRATPAQCANSSAQGRLASMDADPGCLLGSDPRRAHRHGSWHYRLSAES